MSEHPDEELSRIYRELDRPQPPQRIDDAILAASRRAAGSRPQTVRRILTRFWDNPVALAATIVLTFTVTLMMLERPPELEADKEATLSRESARPLAMRSAPAPVDSVERRREAKEEAREAEVPKPAAPPPAKRASEFAASRDAGRAQGPAEERLAQKPGFVPDAPARADSAARSNVQPRAMQDKRSEPEAQAQTEADLRLRKSEAAPVAAAPALRAPASAADSATGSAASASPAVSASGALAESSGANLAAQRMGVRGITAQELAEAKQRSPEDWIKAIRQLKTEGKTVDVERELAEFKHRYPDYRLPDDLR